MHDMTPLCGIYILWINMMYTVHRLFDRRQESLQRIQKKPRAQVENKKVFTQQPVKITNLLENSFGDQVCFKCTRLADDARSDEQKEYDAWMEVGGKFGKSVKVWKLSNDERVFQPCSWVFSSTIAQAKRFLKSQDWDCGVFALQRIMSHGRKKGKPNLGHWTFHRKHLEIEKRFEETSLRCRRWLIRRANSSLATRTVSRCRSKEFEHGKLDRARRVLETRSIFWSLTAFWRSKMEAEKVSEFWISKYL